MATKQPEAAPPDSEAVLDPEIDKVVAAFLSEHAKEIASEADKPFQPIGGIHEEASAVEPQAAAAAAAPTAAPAKAPATAKLPSKKLVNPEDEQRGSVLQKIAKLDVKGRIQLAMKGNKEERSILVRDGTKIVALAVLDSPKITDGEVEKFANQKNVLEALLRAIPMKRRFAKNYVIVRNLVANPRTPLDVSLGLIKNFWCRISAICPATRKFLRRCASWRCECSTEIGAGQELAGGPRNAIKIETCPAASNLIRSVICCNAQRPSLSSGSPLTLCAPATAFPRTCRNRATKLFPLIPP